MARQTADICGVNRNTVNRYYDLLRRAILSESIREARREICEYEFDESYFGARRVGGKRGRGTAGKTPVFGLLKRGEKLYVTVVSDCSRESLMPVIKGLILEQSTIYTDGWRAYDGLVLNGYEHYRVFHCENEFVRGKHSQDDGRHVVCVCGVGEREAWAVTKLVVTESVRGSFVTVCRNQRLVMTSVSR